MHALVINRLSLSATPYAELLGAGWDVTVLCANSDAGPREHETVLALSGFPKTPDVELTAAAVHSRTPVDLVITMSEHDVIRAARLRERLDVPGQSVDSALAFRDKLRMKSEFATHGIPHATCSSVESIWDLLDHADRVGYPVVVKPRRGAGSAGVEILRSADDIADFAHRHPELDADEPCDLMAERYVDGEMMHVDGVWADGEFAMVCASTLGESTNLDFHVGQPLFSVALDVDSDLHRRCVNLMRSALQALPTPSPTIFHAEFFLENDELLVNEIACRMGGAKIHRALRAVYDMSMTELYLGLLGGRLRSGVPMTRRGSVGWILVPPREGTVLSLPDPGATPEGVEELRIAVRVGDRLERPALVSEAVMTAVVVGDDEDGVGQRLEEVRRWLASNTVIESPEVFV